MRGYYEPSDKSFNRHTMLQTDGYDYLCPECGGYGYIHSIDDRCMFCSGMGVIALNDSRIKEQEDS